MSPFSARTVAEPEKAGSEISIFPFFTVSLYDTADESDTTLMFPFSTLTSKSAFNVSPFSDTSPFSISIAALRTTVVSARRRIARLCVPSAIFGFPFPPNGNIYRSPSNEKLPELNLITDLIPIESDRASSLSLVERLYLYFSKFTSSSSDFSAPVTISMSQSASDTLILLIFSVVRSIFSVGSPFSLYS